MVQRLVSMAYWRYTAQPPARALKAHKVEASRGGMIVFMRLL
jgi:hypothetical protein